MTNHICVHHKNINKYIKWDLALRALKAGFRSGTINSIDLKKTVLYVTL